MADLAEQLGLDPQESSGSHGVPATAPAEATGASTSPWPDPNTALFLDALADALVAADSRGTILYANPRAEKLLGWPLGGLRGQHVTVIVPPSLHGWLPNVAEGTGARPRPAADPEDQSSHRLLNQLVGRRLRVSSRHRDGTEIPTELVLSLLEHPDRAEDAALAQAVTTTGPIIAATLRPRGVAHLSRWSELTATLFDTLSDSDPERSADCQLLRVLGEQLGWDVTALWKVSAQGELGFREVWVDPRIPDSERLRAARWTTPPPPVTLPQYALKSGEPLWVPDLAIDERFADGPAALAGLHTAVVFPIRYGGAIVGVVELFSQEYRPGDPGLVDLVRAVSRPAGELLGALELAAERERTLRELEKGRARQEFVLEATRLVSEVSDFGTTLRHLAEAAVPTLGDLCLIDLVADDGTFQRMVCHHNDPAMAGLCEELERNFAPDPRGDHPSIEAVRNGQSRWSGEMTDDYLRRTTRSERHYEVVKALGFKSYMAVPLVAGGRVLGTVTLVSTTPDRGFDEDDLDWAEQLASQVASVIDRARQHHRDSEISHIIQRSLLPDRLPEIEGISLAARYLPGTSDADVGGDWYDVVVEGHRIALVVGDVEGHDARAASVMGKLRHGLSILLCQDLSAGSALAQLSRYALHLDIDRLATVLIAVVDSESRTLAVASAGHPPPVVRDADGTRLVTLKPAPPLGVSVAPSAAAVIEEATLPFEAGDLVLFTDGLVEKPAIGIDERLAELVGATASGPAEPDALCDHVVASLLLPGVERADDVAVLVASFTAATAATAAPAVAAETASS